MFSGMWFNNLIQIFGDHFEEGSNRQWDTLLSLTQTQKQKNAELKTAVEIGDEFATLELLRRGANANDIDPLGYTCIHRAVLRGHHKLIKHLVEYGANIEKTVVYGARLKPIHLVVYSQKKFECFGELLKHNARLHSKNRSGDTLLQLMVKWAPSNVEIIERILSLGLDANQIDKTGNNCMHLLAASTAPEAETLAAIFVKKGINIECKNRTNGETPLHIACRRGNTYIVDFLLKAGVDINVWDMNGATAFDNISKSGEREVYSVFVKHLVLRMNRGYIVADYFQEKIKSTELYEDFVQDINRLKLETVSRSSRVTYYDILCENKRDVAKYLRTREIKARILENYNNITTMYKREIHHRFEEALKLCEDEEYAYRIVDTILGARLPHLCVAKISSYLSPDDLQVVTSFLGAE